MKQNKKWILIAMIAFVVIAAVVAAILLFPKTVNFTFPPFISKYEDRKNYESQDPNIVFDGVLDDAIWQNQRWLDVDHISEEFIGVKMTTYFGEDGLYMAFDVDDYGVYYDKYRYIDYNSGLQLYISPLSGAKNITDCGYEISLNAGEMVGVKQFDGTRFEEYLGRVYMESQIKGEMNSAKATGYTIEAYIDYALLGENCKEVFAYPAIVHTTSATESERQWYSFGLNEKGVSWTRADTWWSFDEKGLMGHEVTFRTGENGTVEGADFVPNGDDYTFILAPDVGFYAESVKVNGKNVMSQLYCHKGKTLCTVERVEEKLDIQVTYAPVPEETMEISGTVKDTQGNILNAQIWAVADGYSQILSTDAQGNFSGSVPAIEDLELFASAEGYVSEDLVAKAGENPIRLAKMYFGNNEQVVRSCTNMALWDLNRMYQDRVRMISSEYSQQLVRSDIYSKNIYASTKLFTDVEKGADTRAGFTFYVNEGLSAYVALTMHGEVNEYNPNGELSCSLQIIAEQNGERIWGNGGIIVPIENPEKIMKLATTEGVLFAVHYNKGAFDVWVDGQQVGYGIYPKDENGKNRLKTDDAAAIGLETWSSRAIYEDLMIDGNYRIPRYPSAPGWDLSRIDSGVATSKSTNGTVAMLSEDYRNKLSVSVKLPLQLQTGDDIRAGVVLRNTQGTEVFVALTAHGKSHYSIQVISGGWVSWNVSGKIEDISTWEELTELAKTGGIPMTVYTDNGMLTIGLNGYLVAQNIVPLDTKGRSILGGNSALAPGLATPSTTMTITDITIGSNQPVLKDPVERLWDISKANESTYTSLTDNPWVCLWLSDSYTDQIAVSANLPLKLREGDDIRAGVVLRNEKDVEVFVALTAHGLSHYSVQVISGGWASWAIEGQIEDLSTWSELTALDSIPLTVYIENGKLTLGINGFIIADDVVPLDAESKQIFGSNANVRPGIATAGTELIFTQVMTGSEKPVLKTTNERYWDISKADEGTYSSLTDEPWACWWLDDSYKEQVAITANLPLKLLEGDDIRAGVVLRNEQGIEVFVALTAHGNSHYSVQVISGGWASWAVEGQISDLSVWSDLTSLDSIPMTVYMENGKLTLGINGYVIADMIVPLNAAGKPTFGSKAKVKPGLATAGTALTFTKVTNGTEKPNLKQKLSAEKGGTIVISGDYTAAKYAVLELNIKALDAITYDWNSNIIISPTGEIWDAYDFQIVYGTSQNQNLIKLTGPGASVDGFTIMQEQWINDSRLEKLFGDNGMNIKLIRMDTWAYLLVDMGSGYTVVGKMYIPADQVTDFRVWNYNTAIEVTDYSVVTGESAAIASFNGLDLTLDSNGMALPVSVDNWKLEGRLVIDTETFPWGTGEYRMYAGADSWGQATSVYYNRANWYLQNHTNWSNTQLTDPQWWMLSAESGGMWVRFEKQGSVLTVFASDDGENWTSSLSYNGVSAKGIYLLATLTSQLRDISLTTD